MKKMPRAALGAAVLAAVFLAACGSAGKRNAPVAPDDFISTDTYSHNFPGSEKAICEAARRALLSQGYVISEARDNSVRARKNFQPDREAHMQIEFYVTCASDSPGSNSTTAFATAVRDRYALKKSSTSASLGVGVLGSVSVPFSSSDEALVRVASETIPAKQFYNRFFELTERYLDSSSADVEAEERALDAKDGGRTDTMRSLTQEAARGSGR